MSHFRPVSEMFRRQSKCREAAAFTIAIFGSLPTPTRPGPACSTTVRYEPRPLLEGAGGLTWGLTPDRAHVCADSYFLFLG